MNYIDNCKHNPCNITNPIKRFWRYLSQPDKIYYTPDNTGTCVNCGEMVTVPKLYYSRVVKILFAIIPTVIIVPLLMLSKNLLFDGIRGEIGKFIVSVMTFGVIFILNNILVKIIDACILTFCSWQLCTENDYDIEVFTERAASEKLIRKRIFYWSIIITYTVVILAVIALVAIDIILNH